MDVIWYGASCFRLQSAAVSVLTDPFDLPPGTRLPEADVVTISQREARHRLQVDGGYRLVDGPGEYEIRGMPVNGVATRRTVAADAPAPATPLAGRNFVYTLQMDGVALCHLGRLARAPSAQEVQELGSPDVLLVPLGEPHGLTVQQAVQLSSQLEVKLIVPMLLGGNDDQGALERLCKELASDVAHPEARLSVSSSGLPASARVAVLAAQPPG